MVTERKMSRTLVVMATLALYATMIQSAAARGGGHGGGGHHGGGHHAGHHGGGHNHHPYHPSHHHSSHHASHHHHDGHHDHHHDHHYAHHHHGWHHGDWGPGFWGGAAVGYGLGYGYGNWGGYGDGGGDTYVDNSTNVTPVSNDGDDAADADDSDSQDATAGDDSQNSGFPTDDWPELGVVTYAGQYGGSQGQVVVRVVPGSGAAEAGVVPGDVILSFNGKPVPSADDLDDAMNNAGGKFEIVVWDARTGRKSTLDGALDTAAVAPPANETAATPPAQH